jgi:hypothetical protein
MIKILLFRKTFFRSNFFKKPLILKSYEEYKNNMGQKRFKNLILNNGSLPISSFVKTIYQPRIQMILLKQLQV